MPSNHRTPHNSYQQITTCTRTLNVHLRSGRHTRCFHNGKDNVFSRIWFSDNCQLYSWLGTMKDFQKCPKSQQSQCHNTEIATELLEKDICEQVAWSICRKVIHYSFTTRDLHKYLLVASTEVNKVTLLGKTAFSDSKIESASDDRAHEVTAMVCLSLRRVIFLNMILRSQSLGENNSCTW